LLVGVTGVVVGVVEEDPPQPIENKSAAIPVPKRMRRGFKFIESAPY
jgi:hypothetical protein